MNKQLRIFFPIFFFILSKVVLDIPLITYFLVNYDSNNFFYLLGYASFAGLIIAYIYNKIQQYYPFVYSVSFIVLFLLSQSLSYFVFPEFYEENTALIAIIYFVPGNIILFLLLKGLSTRLSDENVFATESILNYSKHSAFLFGSVFILIAALKYNVLSINLYQKINLGLTLFSSLLLIKLVSKSGNDIIENPQVIRVQNKITKLLNNRFFLILFVNAVVLSMVFAFSGKTFAEEATSRYFTPNGVIRLIGFLMLFVSFLGFGYEIFFRKKIMLYVGIKNSLLFFPVVMILLSLIVLLNISVIEFKPDSDNYFIFLILLMFLLGLGLFTFEQITLPTTYSFYLPIKTEIRNNFYSRSSVYGMLAGITISGWIFTIISKNNYNEAYLLPGITVFLSGLLILLNSLPVFKRYKHELQNYLDVQSRKIIINKGLFRDIINNNPGQFNGTQFVRYVNLMYLSNPVLSRELINFAIHSENNFIQRVGIIKGEKLYMLEALEHLESVKKSKYFKSSPNRDKIESAITRFIEAKQRMDSSKYIHQLSISKNSTERVLGAKLSFYISPDEKEIILPRLFKDTHISVILSGIISGSKIKNKTIIKEIAEKLDNPALANAAYSSLLSCGDIILPILEEAFYETGQTEKVQLRIIQLYGENANENATNYLLKKLNISNQSITTAVLSALSKCTLTLSEEKTTMLKHELQELCKILIWNLSFSHELKKSNCQTVLLKSIHFEIEGNYNRIFNLLSLLYDAKSIKLIQNNLFSKDFEKVNFALELASVLLKDELKLLILPLLQPMPEDEKVKAMQDQIPTEKLPKPEILSSLIQRESKWINQWTKACAIAELIDDYYKDAMPLLLANIINPDIMIGELAVEALFKIDQDEYFKNKNIFSDKFTDLYSAEFLKRIENPKSKGNQDYPLLKYQIIKYLQEIQEFSQISGEVLKKLTDLIIPLSIKKGETIEEISNVDIHNYFYVLYSGSVTLLINNKHTKTYNESTLISTIDLLPDEMSTVKLICDKDSVLYQISSHGFTELLTFYDIIPESIIKKTDNKINPEFEDYVKRKTTFRYVPQAINELYTHHKS